MVNKIKNNDLVWYHILNPTEEDFTFLTDNFKFHPLDIEDCRSKTQRPKIDVYDDYYFMILHYPKYDTAHKFIVTLEIKIFWSKNFVITLSQTKASVFNLYNKVKKDEAAQKELLSKSSDNLVYRILENLLVESFAIFTDVDEEVEHINKQLFGKRPEKTIERISITRKNIIFLDTIFKPQIRLFKKFESGIVKGFAEDMEEYWGNILDYYQKFWDMIEDNKEIIEGLAKTFDSLQTNKINEIMKVLTIFSSIMLPLTFITGLYGMNINLPFQTHTHSFIIVSGMLISVIVSLLLFFKKRKWM